MTTERRDLELTVRVKGRPITNRVVRPGRDLLPDVPLEVGARRQADHFVVDGPDGEHVELSAADLGVGARFEHGDLEIEASTVRRFRLPRWVMEQGQIVLPLLFFLTSLFVVQVELILSILQSAAAVAPAAPEPSPEMIARLLEDQTDGADRGVYALPQERPKAETKIESYYLQPGADGPTKRMGGGKDVARERRDGKPGAKRKRTAPPVVMPVGESEKPPTPEIVAEASDSPQTGEDGQDDEAPSVEITEGWGLTDWYDSEDARRDAHEMKRELEYARQLLRIDPNDTYALQIRAYYEYLAMDMGKARRTYEKMLKIAPDDAATWNNLALIYKREKDYQKEEELYRLSLTYGPDDPNTLNNLAVCMGHQGRFDEALAIMKTLETTDPDDPYADLHRAKIYAMMGKEEMSYRYLRDSLKAMRKLDTLHNIEYQQDIRIDPAFEEMRKTDRFRKLLLRFYGAKKGGWWMLPGTQ